MSVKRPPSKKSVKTRPPQKAATNPRAKEKKASVELTESSALTVRSIELFSVEVDRNYPVLMQSDKKKEYAIGAILNTFDFEDEQCIGFLDIRVAEVIDGTPSKEVNASYSIFLSSASKLSREQWLEHVQFVARTAVWMRFSDLFAVLNTQADLRLPRLPLKPPGLAFEKSEQGEEST